MTTYWIIATVIDVVTVAYLLVIAYGMGLRDGRHEGIAEAKLWRQPR